MLIEMENIFTFTVEQDKILYRSREVSEAELNNPHSSISAETIDGNITFNGFDKFDSKEPPLSTGAAGRNNLEGVSYLYVADDPYTACAEIRPKVHAVISLGQFKALKQLNLFNFSDDVTIPNFDDYSIEDISEIRTITRILFQFTKPVYNPKNYLPSQYISDFIRKNGYDGIAYRSMFSSGRCYTLFNCGESYIKFIKSELVLSRVPEYHIYLLNDGVKLHPPEGFDDEINPSTKTISDQKYNLCQQIKRTKDKETISE